MKKSRIIALLFAVVILCVSCDYITNTKVIINNNSDRNAILWLYKNGEILKQIEIENRESDGSIILIDASNGLSIGKNQVIMILNTTKFGPKEPIMPFEFFDKIEIDLGNEKREITKDEFVKYNSNDFMAIYYLDIINHNKKKI